MVIFDETKNADIASGQNEDGNAQMSRIAKSCIRWSLFSCVIVSVSFCERSSPPAHLQAI